MKTMFEVGDRVMYSDVNLMLDWRWHGIVKEVGDPFIKIKWDGFDFIASECPGNLTKEIAGCLR